MAKCSFRRAGYTVQNYPQRSRIQVGAVADNRAPAAIFLVADRAWGNTGNESGSSGGLSSDDATTHKIGISLGPRLLGPVRLLRHYLRRCSACRRSALPQQRSRRRDIASHHWRDVPRIPLAGNFSPTKGAAIAKISQIRPMSNLRLRPSRHAGSVPGVRYGAGEGRKQIGLTSGLQIMA